MAEIFNAQTFGSNVKEKAGLALVDFYADWCGPCKTMGPVIDELASEYSGKVTIGKLNVDDNNELAADYSVMSIPTIILFKDGAPIDKVVGAVSKSELKAMIDKNS